MTNATASRAEQIRAALEQADADLAAGRTALGTAIADDNQPAAEAARIAVAESERLAAELREALPIAERRDRESRDAEAKRERRAREKAANAQRKASLAAARKVDAALRSLGKAYATYLSTATGGTAADANRVARRHRSSIAAATLHAAPEFADALEVRRTPVAHRQPLADLVERSVSEFPE